MYIYIHVHVCVPYFYDFSTLVGCRSSISIRRIIYNFLNVRPFDYTAFVVMGEGWVSVKRVNHTSWMTAVTPTDRPKSIRNRCVIEVFGGVLCCPLVFEFSVGIRVFFIGLSQIYLFLSFLIVQNNNYILLPNFIFFLICVVFLYFKHGEKCRLRRGQQQLIINACSWAYMNINIFWFQDVFLSKSIAGFRNSLYAIGDQIPSWRTPWFSLKGLESFSSF